ncbi:MAG: transcription-repair coupling factor [Anaerovorax sp.]
MTEQGNEHQFNKIPQLVAGRKGVVQITGTSDGRAMPIVAAIANAGREQLLILTASHAKAKSLAKDLSFFVSEKIYVLPEEEQMFVSYEAKSHIRLLERLEAQKALLSKERCVVICAATAAIKKIAPHCIFQTNAIHLKVGDKIDFENVKERLTLMGYERSPLVEAKGQYSVRGGIADIFTADSQYAYRVELFDDEVDAIRRFDVESQRSVESVSFVDIYPAEQMVKDNDNFKQAGEKLKSKYESYIQRQEEGERKEKLIRRKEQLLDYITHSTNVQLLESYIHYFYEEPEYIWDYMNEQGILVVDDPDRVWESVKLKETELKEAFESLLEKGQVIPKDFQAMSGLSDLKKAYKRGLTFLFMPFPKQPKGVDELKAVLSIPSKQPTIFNGRMDFLETELKRYVKLGYEITILCATNDRIENLKSFLVNCKLEEKVVLAKGGLTSGIEFPEEKLVYIWDGDIFTTQKQRKSKGQSKNSKPISAFIDIKKGDFVVHENHGIGKFMGIEPLIIQKVKKDYLKIKYAGEDVLYIPVDQMDIIQKYVGADTGKPKISKLSSGEWKKTKARAKAAIENMAKELLELSAARAMEKGYAFGPDTPWQQDFEDLFPYEETQDQLRCIREIKKDMEKELIMDRLLCGDVGYGKTEVAARAIFKCVAEGKQAAVLVPTTILANQHYFTFKNRFEQFPFKVEMLCRFRTEKQQEEIITKTEKGIIDILVGTHRVLSKDVHFKNLGLLVIDEEQRFGVQHKEVIKMLKKNVDVLTLSATPIPRTLHMSLVGIKEMSLIEEPPEERYPVQTYVMEYDEDVIGEAIQREIDRNGQVYVVYNQVSGINRIAAQIRELVPEAKVAVGHGQLHERQLEDIMVDFVNQEYNVLVATTIIESGLDIPNANTMIIIDADKYGLSQLYQLRGRVGRSNRMAYAYLTHQKDKVLSEVAEKRLRAIKEFTEFGAGFKIAMRDLEIRGAGNLLGTEQHGHMMMIGYELYCKLIEDAVRELKGETIAPRGEEAVIEIDTAAYISEKYIEDETLRLQMYKKIAAIQDSEDSGDIIDELMDRFGSAPKETLALIKISEIRGMAEKVGITRIHYNGGKIVYDFGQQNNLKPEAMANLVTTYGMKVMIHAGVKPFIKCNRIKKEKLDDILNFLQLLLA